MKPCQIQPVLTKTERTDDQELWCWVTTNQNGVAVWCGNFTKDSPAQRSWGEDLCVILETWLDLPEDSVTFDGERWWVGANRGNSTGEG